MTGVESANAADPALLLTFLRDKASDRKLRLFACACCRLLWRLLTEDGGRARVEAVERRLERRTAVPPRREVNPPTPQRGDTPAVYAEVASIFAGCDDPFAAALRGLRHGREGGPLRRGPGRAGRPDGGHFWSANRAASTAAGGRRRSRRGPGSFSTSVAFRTCPTSRT